MRAHTEAIGKVCAYAATLGYEFNYFIGQDDIQYVDMGALIACLEEPDYFKMMALHRVSNVDGYGPEDSVPLPEEETLQQATDEVDSEYRIKPLIEMVNGVEYLDGIRAQVPLFVYEDDFSIRTFDTRLNGVQDAASAVFKQLIDEHGIDLAEDRTPADEDSFSSNLSGFH